MHWGDKLEKVLAYCKSDQSAYYFVCLSGVCDDLCRTLYVFPVSSRELLCVPGRSICIVIGLCWTLFINNVRSCMFAMA